MKKSKKIAVTIASVLVAAGILLFVGVGVALNFDFKKVATTAFEQKTYFVTEEFSSVSVVGRDHNVKILPAEGEEVKAVCSENEKMNYAVTVSDGTLKIEFVDGRKWYDYVGIFTQAPEIAVYLPSGEYRDLTVEATSGEITVSDSFSFAVAQIENSSGGIDFRALVTEELSATTSSGNVSVENASPARLELRSLSGKITVENVSGNTDLNVNTSSGSVKLIKSECKSIDVQTSSGNIRLGRCDAESLFMQTKSGSVRGTLLTEKVFLTRTSSGSVSTPNTVSGGRCEVITSSGNIKLEIYSA